MNPNKRMDYPMTRKRMFNLKLSFNTTPLSKGGLNIVPGNKFSELMAELKGADNA